MFENMFKSTSPVYQLKKHYPGVSKVLSDQ
jgi:hypothetical protein